MSRRHPVVARLLVGLGCYFFLNGIMQSLVSLRGVAAGLSGGELGLTLGLASGALGIALDMPVALRADRRGKYPVVLAGMAFFLAAGLALLAGGRALLITGAVLAGLGVSAGGNALLSWLGTAVPPAGQARLQGLNGSVQRVGALLAAGLVGVAIAAGAPALMAAGAAVVAAAGFLASRAPVMRQADTAASGPGSIVGGFRRGFGMLSRPGLVLASGINLAINVIFLETNSYVPLIHGPHRAIIVTGTLVARDVAAAVVGGGLAITGLNVAYPALVAGGLAIAGACAWAGSLATGSLAMIALGGVQGGVIGMGIAAANLFTISAIAPGQRTLAMAAAVFPSRVMYIALPIASSVVLRSAGLPDVFRLLAVILIVLAGAALILSRPAIRATRTALPPSPAPPPARPAAADSSAPPLPGPTRTRACATTGPGAGEQDPAVSGTRPGSCARTDRRPGRRPGRRGRP